MGHFARIRAPGAWIPLDDLHSAECELFDAHLFAALNGDAGGSWAPSAQIVLGGQGLRVDGPVEGTWVPAAQILVQGQGIKSTGPSQWTDCRGLTFLNGTSTALWIGTTKAVFSDTSQCLLSDHSLLRLTGNAEFLMAVATTAVVDALTWDSTGTDYTFTDGHFNLINKIVSLDAATSVADASTTTRTGPTIYSGTAAARGTRMAVALDADSHYTPNHFDELKVPRLATADRTYTLDPPDDNIECEFDLVWYALGTTVVGNTFGPSQSASTKDLNVVSSTGSVDITLLHNPSSVDPDMPSFWRFRFRFNGSDWAVIAKQKP